MINEEFVEAKQQAAQAQLASRIKDLENAQKQAQELELLIHNMKVQIATYQNLLTDATPSIEAEVKETIESLVAE